MGYIIYILLLALVVGASNAHFLLVTPSDGNRGMSAMNMDLCTSSYAQSRFTVVPGQIVQVGFDVGAQHRSTIITAVLDGVNIGSKISLADSKNQTIVIPFSFSGLATVEFKLHNAEGVEFIQCLDIEAYDAPKVARSGRAPQLWIYSQLNMDDPNQVTEVEGLIDRGSVVGYTGLLMDDYKFYIYQSGNVDSSYPGNVNSVISYANSKGMIVVAGIWPFGYSDAILNTYSEELVEPLLHSDAQFVVSSNTLVAQPITVAVRDGGFETHSGNTFTSWDYQDSRTVADTTTYHSGSCSAKFNPGSNNARVMQSGVTITPWKFYHVSAYVKTSSFSGDVEIEILDYSSGATRNFNTYSPQSTQDWTQMNFVFHSKASTSIDVYVGSWGGSSGTLWFDDVTITEFPLFNVVERDGAPFKVSDPSSGHVYSEGTDYNTYKDPNGWDEYHTPAALTIPTGSSLTSGKVVRIDHYGIIPVYGSQLGACLTHPNITTYMTANVAAVSNILPPGTGFFLGYDEMRHMGSCQYCQAAAPTAGQLLANHANKSVNLVRNYVNKSGVKPNANSKVYFWNDMFDPNHNAVADYYYVPTTLANSWTGLPSDAIIFNWLRTSNSINFFVGLGLQQILAGYYDSGDGTGSGQSDVQMGNGVQNVLGFMYTTWTPDYSQLENYANAITSAWSPGPITTPTSSPTIPATQKPVTPAPTKNPTTSPTKGPTTSPTTSPSPTKGPTTSPTKGPTTSPTKGPTTSPTKSATIAPTNAPTSTVCVGPIGESGTATITCPIATQKITSIQFASYGTPSGACGSFVVGSCNAATSVSYTQGQCLNLNSCSIAVGNSVFGDPCAGTVKHFDVQVLCQ